MTKKKFLFIIVILIILIIISFTWISYSKLDTQNRRMEDENQSLNIKIEELNLDLSKEQNKNDELASENEELNDIKNTNIEKIQDLLNEVRRYKKEIYDQKHILEELDRQVKNYRHEEINNAKNNLKENLKLGLPRSGALEILGDDYQEVQGADYPSWRFDLLTDEAYIYNNSHDVLDIEGMMDDKVGIVVFVNWTNENEIWYYTILYKNIKENSIWEYRVFANDFIREIEIYKEWIEN